MGFSSMAAASGVMLARAGIAMAERNIANASTPNHAREEMSPVASAPTRTGSGFFGGGVTAGERRAVISRMADKNLLSADASTGMKAKYYELSEALVRVAGSSSISESLTRMRQALGGAGADPSSKEARNELLSAMKSVGSSLGAAWAEADEMGKRAESELSEITKESTDKLAAVAKLNGAIADAEAATGSPATEARSLRFALQRELSEKLGVSWSDTDAGAMGTVGGAVLVSGRFSMKVSSVGSEVTMSSPTGGAVSSIQAGGQAGAISSFLVSDLASYKGETAELADGLAETVNSRQKKGSDVAGASGQDLFGRVGWSARAMQGNSGGGAPGVSSVNPGFAGFSAGGLVLRRISTGWSIEQPGTGFPPTVTATLPATIGGVALNFAGTAATGDSWTVYPFDLSGWGGVLSGATPAGLALAGSHTAAEAAGNVGASLAGPVLGMDETDPWFGQTTTLAFSDSESFVATSALGSVAGTRSSDGSVSVGGWKMHLSGNPASGDSFTVSPGGLAMDGSNAGMMDSALDFSGLFGSVSSSVSKMGSVAATRRLEMGAEERLKTMAEEDRSSISGVSLDEEAAAIEKWTQIYQASAKAMAVEQGLFDFFVREVV